MATIFDGKAFATKREKILTGKINKLRDIGVNPKMVSILVGDNPASLMYLNLKKKAAERMGAEVVIMQFERNIELIKLTELIEELNSDITVHGIMIQLPLPDNYTSEDRDLVIDEIAPGKDVDGLRKDSDFIAPTAMSVLKILKIAFNEQKIVKDPVKLGIIGATGFIGRQIIKALGKSRGEFPHLDIHEMNTKTGDLGSEIQKCDAVISVTGRENLVKTEMLKQGVVLIDVGAPKGDVEIAAYEKAGFISPVPGGVGPVTISCLLENLVLSASV